MESLPPSARSSIRPLSPLDRLLNRITWLPEWFFEMPSSVKRPIFALIIFLIVVLPAFVYDEASRLAYDSANWVAHTQAVSAKIYQTLYDLRDGDAALRTQIIIPAAQQKERSLKTAADVEASIERLPQDVIDLQQMSIDNPVQQERIGQLRASVDGRVRTLAAMQQAITAGHRDQAAAMLADAIPAYPFRKVTGEMIEEEMTLLGKRLAAASSQKRRAVFLLWSSVAAQLILIGVIYLLSEKDLARRRTAEEASAESAAHAQTIVETNPDPLVVLDAAGRIRSANKAFSSFYGIDSQRARGLFLREVGQGAWDQPELQQRLADIIPQGREIWDLEVSQLLGGERRFMLLNARPFPGAFGQKLILVAAKDVTARKRTEEQITRLNQELALRMEQATAMNQELEAFSYSVSHDLRAPLRHITGFADMLNNHLARNDDPKTQRYLKYIRESADQMGTLIDDLLVFSRMGRTEMTRDEVDMNELVRGVIKHFSLETEGRRIDFRVDPLPSTRGDGAMLRLVWMNLIGNAIKYSRQRDQARIEIGTKASEGTERVYFIRDNGVGFNMKYVHKLFGVFQRLHQADEYEGTGIGLANVRRIVQRHGGKVWAQGYIDQGATFYFSLPLDPGPLPDPAPAGTLNS